MGAGGHKCISAHKNHRSDFCERYNSMNFCSYCTDVVESLAYKILHGEVAEWLKALAC